MVKRILYGDRIRLRPLQKKDIPHIIARNFDPEVIKWTTNSEVMDEKTRKIVIRNIKNLAGKKPKNNKTYVIEIKNGRIWKPIGDCGLSGINELGRDAAFFIAIDPDRWGKRYGTEATKILFTHAFEKLQFHRIESYVAEFNKPSIAFHKKFGFVEESRQKEAGFQNSRFWDRIIFRLLKSEWESLTK